MRHQLELEARNKAMPRAVLPIQRDGKLGQLETAGSRDRQPRAPMKADVIFRIPSMTKPVVTGAAMLVYRALVK